MSEHAYSVSAVKDCVVGQRGTVTLPETILNALGIGIGDTVRFEVRPDQVTVLGMKLIPAKSQLAKLADQRVKQIAKGNSIELGVLDLTDR